MNKYEFDCFEKNGIKKYLIFYAKNNMDAIAVLRNGIRDGLFEPPKHLCKLVKMRVDGIDYYKKGEEFIKDLGIRII